MSELALSRGTLLIRSNSLSLTLTLASVVLVAIAPVAKAQNPVTFNFTGEITSVDDSLGWFNHTYSIGQKITGSYTFFDSGYATVMSGDPNETFYRFAYGANSQNIPITNPKFSVKAGGREIVRDTFPSAFYYGIDTWNNDLNTYPSVGDGYRVQSPIAFPSFFTDFSGDPVEDPDGNFFPVSIAGFRLADPTGIALNSIGLPLTPPNISVFSQNRGFIVIADGNGEADYATALFRVTSLTAAVPEPGSIAFLLGAGVTGVCIAMRRRRRDSGFAQ